jgi:hypothetical protein
VLDVERLAELRREHFVRGVSINPERAVTTAPPVGGAWKRPTEQRFFGLVMVEARALEVHLEGDA